MRLSSLLLAFAFACNADVAADPAPSDVNASAESDTASYEIALMAWSGVATWTAFTTDNSPPSTCPAGSIATGFDCDGSYCDNVRLKCQPTTGLTYGTRTWSTFFSEESTSYRTCSGNGFVTGIACRGSYCDDMTIECTTTNRPGTSCTWSAWFSEEDATFNVPAGTYIKGLQCSGSRCDNVRAWYCVE